MNCRLKIVALILLVFTSCKNHKEVKQSAPIIPHSNKVYKDMSDPTKKLNGHREKIKLIYIAVGCACPNWMNVKDENFTNHGSLDSLMYLEPAKPSLEIDGKFNPMDDYVLVTGEFYDKIDYPKGTTSGGEEQLPKARVFRYTKVKVIKK